MQVNNRLFLSFLFNLFIGFQLSECSAFIFFSVNQLRYIMRKIPHSLSKIAQVKLSYKSSVPQSERIKISSSKEAYYLFRGNWDEDKIEFVEEFKVMLLNSANYVLGVLVASVGNVSSTSSDLRIIFQSILLSNATAIVLCHNHPSGDFNPSQSDVETTRKIKEVGDLMEIHLMDHIIINKEDYYSFNDNGLL